jgi:hypothetical protein
MLYTHQPPGIHCGWCFSCERGQPCMDGRDYSASSISGLGSLGRQGQSLRSMARSRPRLSHGMGVCHIVRLSYNVPGFLPTVPFCESRSTTRQVSLLSSCPWPAIALPTLEFSIMATVIHSLDSGWAFKERNGSKVPSWLPVAHVPTNVHLDLMANNM